MGKVNWRPDMKINVPDFTKPDTLKDRTDGELFAIIGSGKDPMPSQGSRLTETHRWNLVNYVGLFRAKYPRNPRGKNRGEHSLGSSQVAWSMDCPHREPTAFAAVSSRRATGISGSPVFLPGSKLHHGRVRRAEPRSS